MIGLCVSKSKVIFLQLNKDCDVYQIINFEEQLLPYRPIYYQILILINFS
jgi:hypothetical protein